VTNAVSQLVTSTNVIVDIPITGLIAINDSPTLVGDLTTLTATITGGTNVAYLWMFSDGGTSNDRVTTHLFDSVGIHSATITATNSLGSYDAVTEIMIGEVVTLPMGSETYTTTDGTLVLEMPSPLTATLTITYMPLTTPTYGTGSLLFAGQSFQLSITDEDGNPIIEFDPPITLTLYYDESQLPPGLDENDLTLQRYDTDLGTWVDLEVISRDTDADTITLYLDHLSEFALLKEQSYLLFCPVVVR